jgi:hypothetical protein
MEVTSNKMSGLVEGNVLSRISIPRGCRARQCLLLYFAKSISCCPARNWRVSSQIRAVFVPQQRDFSLLCSFSSDVLVAFRELRNSVDQLPRFGAAQEHGKQTNEFAAYEQLRAAAARNRYPALGYFLLHTV